MATEQILQSDCELSPIMCQFLKTDIPIWEMFSMTEEAHMDKYHKQCATDASGCDVCESESK